MTQRTRRNIDAALKAKIALENAAGAGGGGRPGAALLSIRRQCALLGVARSGVYRASPAANDNDILTMMRQIDELFTAGRRDMSSTASECGG
jgi:hypothetical protein